MVRFIMLAMRVTDEAQNNSDSVKPRLVTFIPHSLIVFLWVFLEHPRRFNQT